MKVSRKTILPIFLIILSLIPLVDLLKPGMFLSHDGEAHIARLAAFYYSLTEGNLIPRWGGNLNAGFGHPVLMFLFPLPMYLGSIFHFFGFSFIDSVKLVFALSFIASGLTMYLWIKEIWGEISGFIAAIFYLFAPYRFVDIYVRGAIGESLAFVFPPLAAYFLLRLSKGPRWIYLAGGSLSLAGLITAHNALSLMFLPVIFGYLVYLLYLVKKRLPLFLSYLLVTGLGLGLSAFFWVPSFFEGKYTLRDIVLAQGEYLAHFPSLWQLFFSSWGYGGSPTGFSFQIGLFHWLVIFASAIVFVYFLRRKDKNTPLFGFLIGVFLVTLFLLLPVSAPVWQKISILPKFQFPWRFLSLAIFPPAVLAGGLIYSLPKKYKLLTAIGLLFGFLLLNKDFWQAKGYFVKSDRYFLEEYQGTTDTGESSPRWGLRGMEEIGRKPAIEIIGGQAEVTNLKRFSNFHLYQIKVASEQAQFVENTLYFPGWQVLVDGRVALVEFQDPNHRGLMTFYVPQGQHELKVVFAETRLRTMADLVSLGSLTILTLGGSIIKAKLWLRFR